MNTRHPSSVIRRSLKVFRKILTTNDGRRTTIFCVLALALVFSVGCHSKPKFTEGTLPLPPAVDSGVYDGQYVQTDYGFGFPLPSKWIYLRLSADQEEDEVGRFCDPARQMIARVSVQIRDANVKFSGNDWGDGAQQNLKDHQFKIKKREGSKEWKTSDSGSWTEVSFRVTDPRAGEWADEEWALAKDDLLISVNATLPAKAADTEAGKKLFKSLEGCLTQIHWYRAVGPRGISVERFELQHFTEGFRQSLESRSLSKTGVYFDEMYPERAKWTAWYQQLVSGDPASFELKAELSGLVINGDLATATFTMTRKDKDTSKTQKLDRSFNLSKKEGHWEIVSPADKN